MGLHRGTLNPQDSRFAGCKQGEPRAAAIRNVVFIIVSRSWEKRCIEQIPFCLLIHCQIDSRDIFNNIIRHCPQGLKLENKIKSIQFVFFAGEGVKKKKAILKEECGGNTAADFLLNYIFHRVERAPRITRTVLSPFQHKLNSPSSAGGRFGPVNQPTALLT